MSAVPSSNDAGEQLSLPGVPVAGRQAVWRQHTAERWLRDDPEAYAECMEAVRNGETNQTVLAERFGVSRNSVHSLMMKEFSVEQLQSINAKRAAIVAGQALDRAGEVAESATKRELGPLALLAKSSFEIGQLGSGGPTEIREERHVVTVEDFQRRVGSGSGMGSGMGLGAGNDLGVPPGLSAGLLPEAVGGAVPGTVVREAEMVPLSDNSPLKEEGLKRSESGGVLAFVLLFVPVLGWLMGLGAWERDLAGNVWAGILNRGGGGQAGASAPELSIHSATGNFLALPTAEVGGCSGLGAPEAC